MVVSKKSDNIHTTYSLLPKKWSPQRTTYFQPSSKLNNPNVKLVFMFLLVWMMVLHVFHVIPACEKLCCWAMNCLKFVEMRCPRLNSRKAFHRIEHTAYSKIILVDMTNFQSKEVSIRGDGRKVCVNMLSIYMHYDSTRLIKNLFWKATKKRSIIEGCFRSVPSIKTFIVKTMEIIYSN